MSEELAAPIPYKVTYSARVIERLKNLVAKAKVRGQDQRVLQSLREIDRILRIYPQFGQPLQDLALKPLQLWIGTVAPLVVHYILDEDRRQVLVVRPLKPLRSSGL